MDNLNRSVGLNLREKIKFSVSGRFIIAFLHQPCSGWFILDLENQHVILQLLELMATEMNPEALRERREKRISGVNSDSIMAFS